MTWAKYSYDATVQKFGYKMIFIFAENGSIYGLKSAQTCLLWTRIYIDTIQCVFKNNLF